MDINPQYVNHKLIYFSIMLVTIFTQATSAGTADSTSVDIRKNFIYSEISGNGLWGSLNYDRNIPLGPRTGLVLRAGLSWYEKLFPLGEVNILRGKQRHHLEAGVGFTAFVEGNGVFTRLGYRFHGDKGMLVRVAPLYCVNQRFFWFGVSLGYSF